MQSKNSYIIFYDLETTDLCPVGQILNFALVATDYEYNEVEELKGTIRISKTQLPNPYAILSNRVDVIEHQKSCTYNNERDAMLDIAGFINYYKEQSQQPLIVVGYNSTRFDLLFLRTSMTRNGVNPYIGSPKNKTRFDKDVLHIGQYVASTDPEFRKLFLTDEGKVSLRLERVATKLGLLTEAQKHESRADVDITIELAKYYNERYGIHLSAFQSYQVHEFENDKNRVNKIYPYDDKHHNDADENSAGSGTMIFLEGHNRERSGQSLWVDLEKWEAGEGKKSVSWYNIYNSTFFFGGKNKANPELVEKIQKDLSNVTLENFFPDKNCDVESWIYMLDLDRANELSDIINKQKVFSHVTDNKAMRNGLSGALDQKGKKYLTQLYKRYVINTSSEVDDLIKGYALYRYGGKLKTNRFDCDSIYKEGVYNSDFHSTWNELIKIIIDAKISPKAPDDVKLLTSLQEFYYESDIYKIAGKELEQINRIKDVQATK